MSKNITEQHVATSVRSSLFFGHINMQVNAHCKIRKTVKQYFKGESIEVTSWPAQSSDLISIENCGNIIGDNVRANKSMAVTDLLQRL